jgi:hypothetical protein
MLLDLGASRAGARLRTSLHCNWNKEKLSPLQKSHETAFFAAKKPFLHTSF